MLDRVFTTGEPQVAREWRVVIAPARTGDPQEFFVDFVVSPTATPKG